MGNNFDWTRDIVTLKLKSNDQVWIKYEISSTSADSILWTAGHKWEQGIQGEQGKQGTQGVQGETGAAGKDGKDGANGKDAVINVVTQAEYDALPDKTGVYFIGG